MFCGFVLSGDPGFHIASSESDRVAFERPVHEIFGETSLLGIVLLTGVFGTVCSPIRALTLITNLDRWIDQLVACSTMK